MKGLTKLQKILIGVGVGVVVIAGIGGGVGAALSGGSSDSTKVPAKPVPLVELPRERQIDITELEIRLSRVKESWKNHGFEEVEITEVEAELAKAKTSNDNTEKLNVEAKVTRFEEIVQYNTLSILDIRDKDTREDKRDDLEATIADLEAKEGFDTDTDAKVARDKLKELLDYFRNKENLLAYKSTEAKNKEIKDKAAEIPTEISKAVALFSPEEQAKNSVKYLRDAFNAANIHALDEISEQFLAGTKTLTELADVFSTTITKFLTDAKQQMNIILNGLPAANSPTRSALKGVKTDAIYHNYHDIVDLVTKVEAEITAIDAILTEGATAAKAEALLKDASKVKIEIDRFRLNYSYANVGTLSRYFDIVNGFTPDITTRMNSAKAVINRDDFTVPALGITGALKTRTQAKIAEVEKNLADSIKETDPVKKSFGSDILYKARDEVEKYIFYRLLVHFGLIDESLYTANIKNRLGERALIQNPRMDQVKETLDKLTDKTSTEYTKLNEIYEMFNAKRTRGANVFYGPVTTYTKIIDKVQARAGYEEVKALVASIPKALGDAEAKIATQ